MELVVLSVGVFFLGGVAADFLWQYPTYPKLKLSQKLADRKSAC